MPDKLDKVYEFRIQSYLDENLKKLAADERKVMQDEMRNLMSRHVHNCRAVFDPSKYQNEPDLN